MAPPCAAQSKSYQGPLTMSGDSDTRHMPSLAHDAKRPRAFLKQPTHSICIFFTPSSRHLGTKPCAVFTRLRPNISRLFLLSPVGREIQEKQVWSKDFIKVQENLQFSAGRQWAIIQWTIWARDVHSIQLLRHLRLPAGNLQLKQDLTQNMIWDLKLHHNVHHDTLFTLRAIYPYTSYPDLKIIRTALIQGMWKLWKLGWKCQKGNMDFIHSDDGWCREDISKYFAKHWRLRHVYWDWLP